MVIMMKKPRITAIVQARMASTRLPGKVLLPLNGMPTIVRIVERLSCSKTIDSLVVATTSTFGNNPIEQCIYNYDTDKRTGVYRYNGDEDDVIGRTLAAASYVGAEVVVEVTGDCPLVDHNHVDNLINTLLEKDLDYVSNCLERSWPDGFDIQVYKTSALQRIRDEHNPQTHCGWNITQHTEGLKILGVPAPKECHFPDWGLTLDTPEDYQVLQIIFNYFGDRETFTYEEIIEFVKEPECILRINSDVKRKDPATEG
jgi:spore coat polysaccharide biosynthesis protein SpsF